MHQLTENIKILQKAVIFSSGKFLILKRAGSSLTRAGKWDLPGGNSEWPQNNRTQRSLHKADIAREIREEIGINIAELVFELPIFFDTYFDASNGIYSVIVGWSLQLQVQPKVRLSKEHSHFVWILPGDFDSYDFGFAGEKNGFIRQIVDRSGI